MPINALDLTRWSRATWSLGGCLWMLMILARLFGWLALSDPEMLLLLALWVVAPLALSLVASSFAGRWKEGGLLAHLTRLIILLHPAAALVGGASFFLRAGLFSAIAAAVWLLFTAVVALLGVLLITLTRRALALSDACLAVALVYLPIGGGWMLLSRLGVRPLGFSPIIVLLTAVHFHFITLAALVITGLTGRAVYEATGSALPRTVYRVAAAGMLVNPLLVAAGITLTRVTGVRFLESAAVALLALSLMLVALLSLRFVVPRTAPLLARWLLAFSSAAVLATMLLAVAYALGAATGAWTISISQMIALHGWVNALAFGLCGLLGWRLRMGRS